MVVLILVAVLHMEVAVAVAQDLLVQIEMLEVIKQTVVMP